MISTASAASVASEGRSILGRRHAGDLAEHHYLLIASSVPECSLRRGEIRAGGSVVVLGLDQQRVAVPGAVVAASGLDVSVRQHVAR